MIPKVIMHTQVSLDGSVKDFDIDPALFYGISGGFKADGHLVGSATVKAGIELFMEEVPPETEADRRRPDIGKGDRRPYWFIPDSRGKLRGLMHTIRGSGYCKDAVVFISKKTPKTYVNYLKGREYDHHVLGEDKVDLRRALRKMADGYDISTVMVDSGGMLGCALMERGLVDEVSLLVSPFVVGSKGTNLFRSLTPKKGAVGLELIRKREYEGGFVHLWYRVLR